MNHIALSELERARYYMVEQQIRPWNVSDEKVLQALVEVQRERFVPSSLRSSAFSDTELPLIINAVDALPKGGKITVNTYDDKAAGDSASGARQNGDSYVVAEVADSGTGIPADVLPHLFTPFYTTKSNGQGIGLTMVRDILVNHGFDFSLTSGDSHTNFTIELQPKNQVL